MSAVTIGANIFFNGTAGSSASTLRIDAGYTADQIFRVGNQAMEIVITNKNGTFANGIRVAFDDANGLTSGQYLVIPGGVAPATIHLNVKHALYVQRDGDSDADYSIAVARKNSNISF